MKPEDKQDKTQAGHVCGCGHQQAQNHECCGGHGHHHAHNEHCRHPNGKPADHQCGCGGTGHGHAPAKGRGQCGCG